MAKSKAPNYVKPPKLSNRKDLVMVDGKLTNNPLDMERAEPIRSLLPAKVVGRPSSYTDDIALKICNYLAEGKTLVQACEEDSEMPDQATIRMWANENRKGFLHRYTRARDLGLDAMAEQLFKIADDGSNDYIQKVSESGKAFEVPNHEHMARSRLRIETRKWYLSKLAPKKYGDRVDVQVTNINEDGIGALLAEVCTPAELEDLRDRLLVAKARNVANSNLNSSVPKHVSGHSPRIDHQALGGSEGAEIEIDPLQGL